MEYAEINVMKCCQNSPCKYVFFSIVIGFSNYDFVERPPGTRSIANDDFPKHTEPNRFQMKRVRLSAKQMTTHLHMGCFQGGYYKAMEDVRLVNDAPSRQDRAKSHRGWKDFRSVL